MGRPFSVRFPFVGEARRRQPLLRTPYVSDADAARIAEATSHLTADPAFLLDALLDTAGRTAPDDTPCPLTKQSRTPGTREEVELVAEERFTRRTVTVVMAVIAALAFVFSFGNVWALALRLGVPHPIAR